MPNYSLSINISQRNIIGKHNVGQSIKEPAKPKNKNMQYRENMSISYSHMAKEVDVEKLLNKNCIKGKLKAAGYRSAKKRENFNPRYILKNISTVLVNAALLYIIFGVIQKGKAETITSIKMREHKKNIDKCILDEETSEDNIIKLASAHHNIFYPETESLFIEVDCADYLCDLSVNMAFASESGSIIYFDHTEITCKSVTHESIHYLMGNYKFSDYKDERRDNTRKGDMKINAKCLKIFDAYYNALKRINDINSAAHKDASKFLSFIKHVKENNKNMYTKMEMEIAQDIILEKYKMDEYFNRLNRDEICGEAIANVYTSPFSNSTWLLHQSFAPDIEIKSILTGESINLQEGAKEHLRYYENCVKNQIEENKVSNSRSNEL